MPLRRVLAVHCWPGASWWSRRTRWGTPTAPRRIVSLNLCTDQLVLALADRDAVRSVTWLARDPQSAVMAAAAADVPVNHGLAEEIIPFAPDLVVAGIYTTRTTVALLKRFGLPVLELDVPQSLPAIAAQIRTVAHALGHPERGEAMVTAMMADLTALAPYQRGHGPSPWCTIRTVSLGARSLIDDLLTRAGLRNLAAELALTHYGRLSLDLLLLGQPDLLILNTRDDLTPSLTHQVLRHPGLPRLSPTCTRWSSPHGCGPVPGHGWSRPSPAPHRCASSGGEEGPDDTGHDNRSGMFPSDHAVARVAPHGPRAARPRPVCDLARRRPGAAPGAAGSGRCPPRPHHARQPGPPGDPAAARPPRTAGRDEPGLAGAAMQGLLRNPLAEPGVVGVSGCAAFGAVLAFYTGLSVTVPWPCRWGASLGPCSPSPCSHCSRGARRVP